MPLKRAHLPQRPLLGPGGEPRELSGKPKLQQWALCVPLVGEQSGAGWPTSQVPSWEKETGIDIGHGDFLKNV